MNIVFHCSQGHRLQGDVNPQGERVIPKVGDFSSCPLCGEWMSFDGKEFRGMSRKDIAKLTDQQVELLVDATFKLHYMRSSR